jgi:hypothetical protein
MAYSNSLGLKKKRQSRALSIVLSFFFKYDVSETGFCFQVELIQVGPIERASLSPDSRTEC